MSSPVEVETSQAGKVEKPKRSWADEGNSSDDESTTPENHNEDKTSDPYAPEPKEQHQQQQQQQQQQHQQQQQRPDRGEAQTGRNSFSDIPMNGPFFAYVGNLPYSISAREVGEFFEGGDCDVQDVIIKFDEQGRGRGFAHVEFKNRDSLLKSFEANGCEIGQRSIKVDYHPVKQKNDRGGRMGGGGDRDRDRNENNREETEVSWVRAPRREPAPIPPKPESNRPIVRGNAPDRGDRGNDRGATRGVSNRDRPAREQEQQPPAVRPKIILAPRKVNVEGEEQPVARVSDIFGGGKPHDENKYEEERKKKIEKERIEAEEVAAKEKELKAIADAAAAASAPVTAAADSQNPQETAPESGETLKTDVDAAADISAISAKLEKVSLDSTSQAIERGVVVPAAATSSDRPLSKQSSRRPSTDSDKGKGGRSNSGREGRGRGDSKYEGRGGFEGRGEGRHEGRGEGRGDGRGRSEGRGRGRGEGRESSGRGGRGRDNRDSAVRAPAAPSAPSAPVAPAVARVQVPLNMNMIGKGSNTGRKAADGSKDSTSAVSAPVVKAAAVPVVAQRNSFSDLGGDDSD